MTEAEKKKPLWKLILKVIYLVFMIVYTAFSLVMAILAYIKFKEVTSTFDTQVKNWKADSYEDFKVIPSTERCPSPYSPVYKYQWPGTYIGCDCTVMKSDSSGSLKKKWYKKKCNSTMEAAKCDPVKGSPEKNMTIFDNKILCGKVLEGVDFFKYGDKLNEDGKCKSGFKKCGGKKDVSKAFCIPNSMAKCPVMDIADSKVDSSYKDIGQGFFITNSEDLDRAPISQVFINEGVACRNKIDNLTTTEKKVNHPLIRESLPVCTTHDGNYTRFGGEVTRKTLFDQNNYTVTEVKGLPSTFSDSQKIRSFKRGYEGLKPKCRKDLPKIKDSEDELMKIKFAQLALLLVSVFVAAIIGIIFTILELVMLFKKCSKEKAPLLAFCRGFKKCFDVFLKISQIAMCSWTVILSGRIKTFYHNLSLKNCGDEGLNTNLNHLSDQISNFVFIKNRNALIIGIIALVVTLIMLIYGCCKKKEGNDSKVAPEENSNAPLKTSAFKDNEDVPMMPHVPEPTRKIESGPGTGSGGTPTGPLMPPPPSYPGMMPPAPVPPGMMPPGPGMPTYPYQAPGQPPFGYQPGL